MSINEKIEQLKASFLILKLENIDSEILEFFIKNLELYSTKKDIDIKVIGDSTLKFVDLGQTFTISFIPNSFNPTQVELKLKNLNGLLEQCYLIKFKDKNIVEVTKKKISQKFNSDLSIDTNSKKTTTTIYSEGIKFYEKNICMLLDSSVDYKTSGFSKEEKYYIDNTIYSSYISNGEEDCTFGNTEKYTKSTNGIIEIITETEYNEIKTNVHSKHPVLTKN